MPLSDKEFESIREEYYSKPDFADVKKQLQCIHERGGISIGKIDRYYFRELWSKVRLNYNRWSIAEAWEYKPIIEYFAGKTQRSEKTFPKSNSLEKNIETAMRLAGFGVASKPSNFSLKAVDMVLQKYNINGKWVDYSCGWGVRMLGAMRNNVEYYGLDPNHELVCKLEELALAYREVNKCGRITDIRCQGSEKLVPEWKGMMGLAFSSPPYFDLEDYKVGNQSWTEGVTYESWLEDYFRATVKNLNYYLTDDGYLAINIKNLTNGPKLADDMTEIIHENGFGYVETLEFKNKKRNYGHAQPKNQAAFEDTNEGIYIFRKC